jgi:DNA polymerase alpha subunit B
MELYQYNYGPNNSDGQPMQLLVASGPFTLDDNFAYEPLDSLAETVATSSPDLLILVCFHLML